MKRMSLRRNAQSVLAAKSQSSPTPALTFVSGRLAVIATILMLGSSQVLAWHDGGHKTVAAIAFRRLTAGEQASVVALLKNHPRFADEFEKKLPDGLDATETNDWMFQQAAVFPDIARSYKGRLQKQFSHPVWHYINVPEFLTPADRAALHPEATLNLDLDPPDELDENSNVIQVIRFARKAIADSSQSAENRAIMLCWLMHTVGDVHQPLHSTALFSRGLFPKGDHGGNSVNTRQKKNLHFLWDDFPGGHLEYPLIRNKAAALVKNSAMLTLGTDAAKDLNEQTWLNESKVLATNVVYDPEVMGTLRGLESTHEDIENEPIDLSEAYLRTGADAAEKRVVQAGFRLGAILSGLFD